MRFLVLGKVGPEVQCRVIDPGLLLPRANLTFFRSPGGEMGGDDGGKCSCNWALTVNYSPLPPQAREAGEGEERHAAHHLRQGLAGR